MCEKCADIDVDIARYGRLARMVTDQQMLDQIKNFIENWKSKRRPFTRLKRAARKCRRMSVLIIYLMLTQSHTWQFMSIERAGNMAYCQMQQEQIAAAFHDRPGNIRVV
jgi:hypothetical protein